MEAGGAWERGQWELAGGGGLPFKKRRGIGSGESCVWSAGRVRCSRHVPAGELGLCRLQGGSNFPGEKLSRGAWGQCHSLPGQCGTSRSQHPGSRSRGSSIPSAVTPRQAHPFASAPIAGSWRGYQLLTTSHTSHGNSEPWGVVRRTAGTRPGEGLRQAARREHTSSAPPDPPILEREVRAVSISPAPLAPWFVQYLSQARDL